MDGERKSGVNQIDVNMIKRNSKEKGTSRVIVKRNVVLLWDDRKTD